MELTNIHTLSKLLPFSKCSIKSKKQIDNRRRGTDDDRNRYLAVGDYINERIFPYYATANLLIIADKFRGQLALY